MGKLIGALAGLLLGDRVSEGFLLTLLLAAVGWGIGMAVDRHRAKQRGVATGDWTAQRLAAIEHRLDALERAAGGAHAATTLRDDATLVSTALVDEPLQPAPVEPVFAAPSTAPGATLDDATIPQRPVYGARPATSDREATIIVAQPAAPELPAAPSRRGPWAWFTDGNTLTRVGVVILFFGVAFLLSWFADHLTLSIEVSLALVALAGALLIGVGAWLAPSRPGYALSLEGAGAGILYLTTFAASRLFDVLPPLPAIVALVFVAALTVVLAWRADSQPMAGLAVAGGFLAPFLVSRDAGEPALLFAWFAVLNGAIFVLAWHRAWRALNALGAVFTFGLGIFWGWRFYVPQHFAVAQPFLALFFAFYLGVAILYARRAPLDARKPVDGIVVFGVPVMAFALEAGLLTDLRYGAACAALAVAAIYATLHLALRRRDEPGLRLLAQAFLALAVVFATLAIPFAVDARWTSAWWALEAAAVYWLGCRQRQPLARVFSLVLQALAAAAFLWGGVPRGAMPLFANAGFLGAAMIGVAALATAWSADRYRESLPASERPLVAIAFGWGVVAWMAAGIADIVRVRPAWLGPGYGNAALAWVVASVVAALAIGRAIGWPRLAWFGAAIPPALVVAGILQFHDARTTLAWPGVLVWPVAWALLWIGLRSAEAATPGEDSQGTPPPNPAWLRDTHTAAAIALVAWASWEASEWAGRLTPRGTAWIACAAALPAVLALALTLTPRVVARWPFARFPLAYAKNAGWVAASALAVWFLVTNLVSPGSATPLPWLPLANPLDLTLAAALTVLALWAREHAGMADEVRQRWLGAALFVAGNGLILRIAHHWGGVPWRITSLMANKPVQAALTLAWTATALVLMVWAAKRRLRALWLTGAALLAAVVVKLFVVDLSALSGLPRIAAFLGVGAMLLAIGYFAPPPGAAADAEKPSS
ncbi:MAG: DUF2339 domain-containing protein [Betaproteobacteria bacterium]